MTAPEPFPPKLDESLVPNRQLWSPPPESDLSCREAKFLATLPFRDCFIITEEATGNVKPNIWQELRRE